MILVDTSVWIDLFSKSPSLSIKHEQLVLCVTCGPIIQEILQGVKQEEKFAKLKDSMLAVRNIQENIGTDDFLAAADIYRVGRKRGLTIRSSMDCLIASLAIKHKVPIWHNDRNFDYITKFSPLTTIHSLNP